jgi:hypothetical protein
MSLLPSVEVNPYASISKLISANTAFVNPLATSISSGLTGINNLKSYVTLASNVINPEYNAGVAIHGTSIINAVDTLVITFNRFASHTNNLSGVSLSTGLNGANLATITSIVASVDKYRTDGAVCEAVFAAFGAILKAAEFVDAINTLLGQIANILSIPEQIANNINFIISKIETQITEDLVAFTNAQLEALQLAAATAITSLIGNPCIGEVLTKIASQELKTEIDKKIRSITK